MMKKIHFKQKRHFVTAVCLLVGMMVLTTSVYANYDNANGYSNYKSAKVCSYRGKAVYGRTDDS